MAPSTEGMTNHEAEKRTPRNGNFRAGEHTSNKLLFA